MISPINLLNNFSPGFSTTLPKVKDVVSTASPISKYRDALRRYLDIVKSKSAVVDAFISSFSSNPEVMMLQAAGEENIDTLADYAEEVSDESAALLLGMFASGKDVLTFTDGEGIPFSFIKKNGADGDAMSDGFYPVISTQQHPISYKDCLLYMDVNGKYYCNPIIRIAEFYDGTEIVNIHPSTVYDAVSILASIINVVDDGTCFNTLKNIAVQLNIYTDEDDINSVVSVIFNHYNIPYDNRIQDIISKFYVLCRAMLNELGRQRIHSSTIYSLLESQVINSELVSMIRNVFETEVSGGLEGIKTTIQVYSSSKYDQVRNAYKQIMVALGKNGIIGAFSAMCSLIQTTFDTTPTEYGVFHNSGSLPRAFSAGFVDFITAATQTLFNVLAAVMNPIISAIGAIGSTIFNVASNFVNANVSLEYAQVGDLDQVENIAPYSIHSFELSKDQGRGFLTNIPILLDNGESTNLWDVTRWATQDGNPLISISFPFCTLKVALKNPQISEDGTLTFDGLVVNNFVTCNDVMHSYGIAAYVMQACRRVLSDAHGTSRSIPTSSNPNGYVTYFSSDILSAFSNELNFTYKMVAQAESVPVDFSNDDSGTYAGYLYRDDKYVKARVAENTLLFLLYLYNALDYNFRTSLFSSITCKYENRISLTYRLGNIYFTPTSGDSGILSIMCGILSTSVEQLGLPGGSGVINVFITPDDSWRWENVPVALDNLFLLNDQDPSYIMTLIDMYHNLFDLSFHSGWCNNRHIYYGSYAVTSSSSYADKPYFTPPKYTRGSVVRAIIIGAVVTVTTAAVIAVSAIAVTRTIRRQRAIRAAKVEHAWTQLTNNPTPENYNAYRKAVRSNNRFTKIFGGSKYDVTNYWAGDISSQASPETGGQTITSYFADSSSEQLDSSTGSFGPVDTQLKNNNDELSSLIRRLIVGDQN